MAVPQFTGAWRAKHSYVDLPALPGPGVDPAHMRVDEPESGSRPPSGAPRMDIGPETLQDVNEYDEFDTPGLILDVEPLTHDDGDISFPVPSPAHMIDRGAVDRNTYQLPAMRKFDEQYHTTRDENLPVIGDLTTATMRGDNSLPLNNPDGVRPGFTVWRRMTRRAFSNGDRRHDERMLQPMTAAKAVQSPPMTNTNRYTSPFGWNSKNLGVKFQLPLQRRQPPGWDESTISGPDDNDQEIPTWVIG